MNKNLLNNYRMGGYLLIAVGLINLRYQSGQSGVVGHSATIIIPGALLLVSTWVSSLVKLLDLRPTKVAVLILGIALVAYAVLN
ncbi:unannotated protein [freshwater metagenome]|uniref:Unannotated protein n=1 Tax=freshwater metagenome TaxID=449393 RepID=A0A6J7T2P2_9ZZZZ|nr:hypothetical protein [Actinomycetota bacterium]